jgi:hypothetical protein
MNFSETDIQLGINNRPYDRRVDLSIALETSKRQDLEHQLLENVIDDTVLE